MVKVVAKQSQQALLDVINLITESGLSITSLEILQPNLESVFLHLTGKKLRE
jgi:ABC-2 type transport system ATP-binding protein